MPGVRRARRAHSAGARLDQWRDHQWLPAAADGAQSRRDLHAWRKYRPVEPRSVEPRRIWFGNGFVPVGSAIYDESNQPLDQPEFGTTFTELNSFSGTFNGQNHTISNLYINRPGQQFVGLLSDAAGATIENVALANGSVTGGDFTGGLAGEIDWLLLTSRPNSGEYQQSTVQSVSSGVNVTGGNQVGGLAGYLHESCSTISPAQPQAHGQRVGSELCRRLRRLRPGRQFLHAQQRLGHRQCQRQRLCRRPDGLCARGRFQTDSGHSNYETATSPATRMSAASWAGTTARAGRSRPTASTRPATSRASPMSAASSASTTICPM